MRPSRSALLPFFGLGLTWSTAIPLGRVAGEAGVPALIFPFAQAFGATLILSALLILRRTPIPRPFPWTLFLVSGLAGHTLPQIIMFITVQSLPLALVGLIIAMNPILTGIVASATGTQTMTAKKAAGIGLGFIAVLIVSLPGATFPGWEALPWIAFGILTPACFAVANTFSARLRPKVNDSLRDSVGMMGVSATALAVVALVAGQSYAFTPWNGGAGDLSLIVHGTLAALAFFLFFVVLERGGPIMVASASYLILLFSGLWGWLFFDEVPSAAFFIAGLFVVVGLTLVLDLLPPQRKSAS